MRPQFGMDAVSGHHHIGLDPLAVGELDSGEVVVLLEADCAVAGVYDPRRQVRGEQIDEVGAVHPERRVQPLASVTCTGAIGVPS